MINTTSPLLGSVTTDAEGLPGMTPVARNDGTSTATPTPSSAPSLPEKMLGQAQGRFDAVKKVYDQLDRVRKGLDKLVEKGDAVTDDDVLDEMATLVAHGADPKNLAAIIAGNTPAGVGPMPPGGEALAGWLKAAGAGIIAPAEAQLRPAMALAQHQLGVAAVHHLIDAHAKVNAAAVAPPASPALAQPDAGAASPPPPSALLH